MIYKDKLEYLFDSILIYFCLVELLNVLQYFSQKNLMRGVFQQTYKYSVILSTDVFCCCCCFFKQRHYNNLHHVLAQYENNNNNIHYSIKTKTKFTQYNTLVQ